MIYISFHVNLEFVSVSKRWNAGEQGIFFDHTFSIVIMRAKYPCRIHGVVCIIKTDVPDTHSVLGLFIEINPYVQPVARRQPVIIAMFYVIGLSNIRGIVINRIVVVIESQNKAIVCSITRTDDGCFFFGNSTGSSCVKHPRGTDVNTFAEFMVESQINNMAPIIFVWKSLSIVDSTFSKFAVAFG